MPNRVIKDAIWDSPTLAKLKPFHQDQFPRWILMADQYGCFNADPKVIKGKAYPLRDEITVSKVNEILSAFFETGLLFLWTYEDRKWGFFVTFSRHHNFHETQMVDEAGKRMNLRRKSPIPPENLLNQYIEIHTKQDVAPRCTSLQGVATIPNLTITEQELKQEQEQEYKKGYGEFLRVLLTQSEFIKLTNKFGEEKRDYWITQLDRAIESGTTKPEKVKSAYATILKWSDFRKEGHVPINKDKISQPKPILSHIDRVYAERERKENEKRRSEGVIEPDPGDIRL